MQQQESATAEQTASIGIKHLKAYLELAASGVGSGTDSAQRERTIDRHRDEIADELRYRGFAVQTDVGLSDFRVDLSVAAAEDPAQPLVAVLLDGEGWRARRTVADRDGLPVDVLAGLMRWHGVERVWLPEWLNERERTLERIETAVVRASAVLRVRAAEREAAYSAADGATATAALDGTEVQSTTVASARVTPSDASAAFRGGPPSPAPKSELRHPDLRQFVEWTPKRSGRVDTLDRLPSPAAAEHVRAVIRDVVQKEGPIHKMRLAKLVAEAFGLSRVAAARSAAILRCLPPEYARAGDRSCAWPTSINPVLWRDVRRSQVGDGRNLDHVPLEEIANAMAIVAELGGGMSEADIKREALALFGGKRMTEGVTTRLDAGLKCGTTSGRIERTAGGIYVAGRQAG